MQETATRREFDPNLRLYYDIDIATGETSLVSATEAHAVSVEAKLQERLFEDMAGMNMGPQAVDAATVKMMNDSTAESLAAANALQWQLLRCNTYGRDYYWNKYEKYVQNFTTLAKKQNKIPQNTNRHRK